MAGSTADTRRHFEHGQVDISTAGTRERIKRLVGNAVLTIRANTGNAGDVYVGNEDVDSSNGFILGPGESIELIFNHHRDRNEYLDIHVDVATSGDDISYIYIE